MLARPERANRSIRIPHVNSFSVQKGTDKQQAGTPPQLLFHGIFAHSTRQSLKVSGRKRVLGEWFMTLVRKLRSTLSLTIWD